MQIGRRRRTRRHNPDCEGFIASNGGSHYLAHNGEWRTHIGPSEAYVHSAEAIIGLTSNNFVKDVTPAKYDSANDTTMVTGGKIPYEEFLASYQAQPVRTMAVAAPIPTN